MKIYNSKKVYFSPIVELVKIDSDISLSLDSGTLPFGDPSLSGSLMDSPGLLLNEPIGPFDV